MATITGTDSSETLTGTSGNDTLLGLGGSDQLDGGPGDDTLDGGSGFDQVNFFDLSAGDVVVNLATGTTSGPQLGHDTLVSIEAAFVSNSGSGSVTVIGDGGDNVLSSFAGGAEYISGGAGNDAIIANDAPGSLLDGGSGRNSLQMIAAYRHTGTFNTVAPTRTTSIQATFTPGVSGNVDGVAYANINYFSLTTGAGNDALTFIMPQASPQDTSLFPNFYAFNSWNAGDGTDTVTLDLSGYSDRLILTAPVSGSVVLVAIPAGNVAQNIVSFQNVENFRIVGGSGDDIFRAGNGNDIFTGGGGNDTIDGGQGTDIARYSGASSDYRIDQMATSAFKVTDLRPGSPDGTDSLSNVDILQWGDGSRTNLYNAAPIVEGLPVVALPGQTLALSSLISVTDYDGNAMTQYQLWDSTRDATSGHFVINGVAQAAGTVINVTGAQAGQVSFVTGTIGDSLQIRAFDGNRWSAQDTDAWSTFSVTINHAPILATADYRVGANWSLPFATLAAAADIDNDLISKYQLWDASRDPNSGHFVVNGVAQAAGTVIEVYSTQLTQVSFVTGTVGDNLQIRAFDGIQWSAADTAAWSPFSIIIDRAPVLTTSNVNLAAGQSRSLSSLISVSDPEGDAITKYQLWDATRDSNSGHFTLGGTGLPAGTVLEITAAQLAQTAFVTGTVNDNLQIRAFDGTSWSAADNAAWAPFLIGPTVNRAPVATTGPASGRPGQSLALSGLVSVSDADGDTIQKYQLWESTRDPAAGHFVVNGVAQPASAIIEVTAAQATQASFLVGTVSANLQIRAFDGQEWSSPDNGSWSPFTVSPVEAAPVVTTTNLTRAHLQTFALSSLFSVSDADGDTITRYQLWDAGRDAASGHFEVNGVAQAAGTIIDISAAQLAQTSFVTGAIGDALQIRAFDGIAWSAGDNAAWAPFTISVLANNAPVVTTSNITRAHLQTFALSSLFSVSDADGDTMTRYQLWDAGRDPTSGHFVVNGVAQAAGTIIDISAAQLAQTSFVTGAIGDALQIRAFDGIAWSARDNAAWAPFNVSVPTNNAPVVGTSDVNTTAGQSLTLANLVNISDADGDTMTRYQLWDSTRDPTSGHFVVAGVTQAPGTVIDISAAQAALTNFVTGTVNDALQIRAFDGIAWSAADNVSWSPFHITV